MSKKQIILFLSWRDIDHPQSGGAEIFTTEMLNRSNSKKDYSIVHLSTKVEGKAKVSHSNGIIYLKVGNWITVLLYALMFYFRNRDRVKFVVDQCNTHRFFIPFWVPANKQIFFIHQLTREIWDMKLPSIFAKIGRLSENWMLKIYKNINTMTVSQSTKNDLKKLGFSDNNIKIIPEGVTHSPLNLPLRAKESKNLFIYVGRYSEYKGLPDATKAFVDFLKINPLAQFVIIGSKNQNYIETILKPICDRNNLNISGEYCENNKRTITLLGRVSEEIKLQFMEKAVALIYPSKREGWGLGVSEAGVLGTPSIVYNSPGLIDAVDQGRAGYLCLKNTPNCILSHMISIHNDSSTYKSVRLSAYEYSSLFRWENTASAFDLLIKESCHV